MATNRWRAPKMTWHVLYFTPFAPAVGLIEWVVRGRLTRKWVSFIMNKNNLENCEGNFLCLLTLHETGHIPYPQNKNSSTPSSADDCFGICYEPRVVLPSKRADPSMIGGCNPKHNVSMEITRSPAKQPTKSWWFSFSFKTEFYYLYKC